MDVLGQDHILRYLSEALRRNRLSPSLLFTGLEGVGKKTVALKLAKHFQCERVNPLSDDVNVIPAKAGIQAVSLPSEKSGSPIGTFGDDDLSCDDCPACLRVDNHNHTDVLLINRSLQAALLREKPESQSAIKIEAIRHIDKFLRLKAMEGRRRVAIIDEAERMTDEAANALLKVLEEPPPETQIVLIATNLHGLLSTIVSRCSVLSFKPVPITIISRWLERVQGLSKDAAEELADLSGGSFAKALFYKESGNPSLDLSGYACDEFFDLLSQTPWHKDGRKKGEQLINHLIESAQKKLNQGDQRQLQRLQTLVRARQQMEGNVPARLVLESLYLSLEPPFTETRRDA